MTDLIKRLKEAPGPSRELDAEIADLFGVAVYLMPTEFDTTAPAYTSDLNVVIALIEEKLPGTYWELAPASSSGDYVARVDGSIARAGHPAVALLLALLEAMEGRDD